MRVFFSGLGRAQRAQGRSPFYSTVNLNCVPRRGASRKLLIIAVARNELAAFEGIVPPVRATKYI